MLLRCAYNVLLALALPFVWLRLLAKARREPAYLARRGERFGQVPMEVGRNVVWFHTVSAGETIGAAPVIRAMQQRLPGERFLVTTMTPAGSDAVKAHLGDSVDHCYAPYDFPWAVARFVKRVQPRALVLMETELWPNTIRAAYRQGAAVALINARLSERSARGYGRIGSLMRQTLGHLERVVCQYDDTSQRFAALGVPRERLHVSGSVKFDVNPPEDLGARAAALRERWAGQERLAWIAGSTHPGEEEAVLAAHAALLRQFPQLLLVLAPRHPSRADAVLRLCVARGMRASRLSQGEAEAARAQVLLVDEMGRLLYLYGVADVALLCGSLVPVGGHNPIEAALHGLPMLMGPHRFNWVEVAKRFAAAGCLGCVDKRTLAPAVAALLANPDERRRQGEQARRTVARNRGALERLLTHLEALAAR